MQPTKIKEGGERAAKVANSSTGTTRETLYFNKMYSWHYDGAVSDYTGNYSKNIFLGETRILTKVNRADTFTAEEYAKQYWYHSDHLGSASLITDYQGKEYERIEYTPYGELWVERKTPVDNLDTLFRFTGKELDAETGNYYYGARYLDPRTSRWLSTDPALGEYIAGTNKGQGGIYNTFNMHLYNYANNNPIHYGDPDGRAPRNLTNEQRNAYKDAVTSATPSTISNLYDCADTALHIYAKGIEAATGQKDAYTNVTKSGKKLTNLQNIQAGDMSGNINSQNQIINYYNSDGSGSQTYDSSQADRTFNSSNIEIGSVGLYVPNESNAGFTGHTVTVTGVTRDENGNVLGISYIEGHMGPQGVGAEQEIHTFTREGGSAGSGSVQNRYSNCTFVGWGEFEPQ